MPAIEIGVTGAGVAAIPDGGGASAPPMAIPSNASRMSAVNAPWIRAPSRTPT